MREKLFTTVDWPSKVILIIAEVMTDLTEELKYVNIKFIGLVAQWTRARGYEPRCQGFESLLAHNRINLINTKGFLNRLLVY